MAPQPLSGLKVVEVGQAVAAPLAGVILAELGAEVIKVEKPEGGDDARLWGPPWIGETGLSFHAYNRGKRQPGPLPGLRHGRPADLRRGRQPAAVGEVRPGRGPSGVGRGRALPHGP